MMDNTAQSIMKKKILILGGSDFQIPLIEKAVDQGLHVVTCDYLPDNPGHKLSDEYYNVSTTDKPGVLALARELQIDAIATFSSDPSIPAVAYVADKLGLPGPPEAAIKALTEKDRFRSMMKNNGLPTPEFFISDNGDVPEAIKYSSDRYMVKPIDSSGNKGITITDGTPEGLVRAVEYALGYSRSRRGIFEEYIDGPQIHGDGFLYKGRLVYHYLGDHYFYTGTNSFIPISTRWPAKFGSDVTDRIAYQVEKIAMESGYLNGPVNIEARIASEGNIYIIETGPRNGGNFVPIIQHRLTGFDFVAAVLALALNPELDIGAFRQFHRKNGAYYILHAEKSGIFKSIEKHNYISKYIFFENVFKKPGDKVSQYTGSNATIGVQLFEFDSIDERDRVMGAISEYVQVVLD